MLEEADGVSVEEVFTDGITNVLEQPEFAQGSKLRGVLEVLRRSDFLEQLLPVLTRGEGVHVIIGHENTDRRHARGEPHLRPVRRAGSARLACLACWARPACRIRGPSRRSATWPP